MREETLLFILIAALLLPVAGAAQLDKVADRVDVRIFDYGWHEFQGSVGVKAFRPAWVMPGKGIDLSAKFEGCEARDLRRGAPNGIVVVRSVYRDYSVAAPLGERLMPETDWPTLLPPSSLRRAGIH